MTRKKKARPAISIGVTIIYDAEPSLEWRELMRRLLLDEDAQQSAASQKDYRQLARAAHRGAYVMTRTAIYCRVSTPGQKNTTSLPEQERLCREKAARLGYEVSEAHVYHDIESGSDLYRPEMERL